LLLLLLSFGCQLGTPSDQGGEPITQLLLLISLGVVAVCSG
jgi:hypothetical protein